MAIHYCDASAGTNGTGSKASPFNDAVACLSGTQAGIADGDTVIFRTKNTGVDITVNYSAEFNIVGAASGSKRIYIMDDGTEWLGDAGKLKFVTTTGGASINLLYGAHLLGGDYRFYVGNNSTGVIDFRISTGSYYDGVEIEQLNTTTSFNYIRFYCTFYVTGSFGKLRYKYTKESNNSGHTVFGYISGRGRLVFDEIDIQRSTPNSSGSGYSLFQNGSSQMEQNVRIKHLKLSNPPTLAYLFRYAMGASQFQIDNLTINNPDFEYRTDTLNGCHVNIDSINELGAGVGKFNFLHMSDRVTRKFLSGKFQPTLSAFDPTLQTRWSIRVDFENGLVEGEPVSTSHITNFYTGATGIKTLNVEMLVYDQLSGLTGENIYAVFQYVDDTGVLRTESTRNTNALVPSEAIWDDTNYGPVNFVKRKFEITTAYPVAQNTPVSVETFASLTIQDNQTFNFINPEVLIS
jgi:hypothetical protein